ncbi:SMP-30/gluconolactonase/LRE family protein [Saccharopolyspora erythraea]|uniref:SMP-30/gluconolactonase/LRE family protein n=1 Tax=Saccharopolyspora erythraea TaxID=1836 RepID=UPI001BA5B312|nr:SMP-30/gluconolactonase/LRE family protein [Saccharopolyspora erythraea]QUH04031.1 SMP-30/gluconolactonase/LRE family protein [Saccharopolyspora erythraea]
MTNKVHVEPVGDVTARFGEGPLSDPTGTTVLWVDITGGAIHRTDTRDGTTTTAELGGEVAAVFPTSTGSLLAARDHQLITVNGRPHPVVAEVEPRPRMRLNDGLTDPAGRVFIGTLHADKVRGTAALYRLDGDRLTPVVPGVTVSNGIAWSPDGSTVYYADTPTLRIDRFDYDSATATPHNRRPFADLSTAQGRPDGLTVDEDGCVWVALITGGRLHRYTPTGRLDRVVELPVTHPTSVAFGGRDLSELFVTSARDPLSAAEAAQQPLAGRLLRLDPGVKGLPTVPAVVA